MTMSAATRIVPERPILLHRNASNHPQNGQLMMQIRGFLSTTVQVARVTYKANTGILLRSWILVPIGVMIMLLLIMGVDLLIGMSGVAFPASVACMFVLLVLLLLSNRFIGHRNTSKIVKLLDIPCGFCLRWLNLLFTPSFVTLPLSPRISFTEVLKIAAVFVFGFLIAMVMIAWSVRGLTLLIGRTKTNPVHRLDEISPNETLPLNEIIPEQDESDPRRSSEIAFELDQTLPPPSRTAEANRARGPGVDLPDSREGSTVNLIEVHQHLRPTPSAQKIAAFVTSYLDILSWALIWIVGIGVYLGTGYSMPAQLPLNILTFFLAMRIPPSVRRFIHPIFPCAALTILGIFTLAAMKGQSLDAGLTQYRTGTPYIQYYFGNKSNLPPPGAGDLLAAVLDVSIVALAIPMFNYRAELKRHFLAIILPNLAMAVASLFAYPAICALIGIDYPRALAFPARSVTLALATPVVNNLGGSIPLVVVLAILSGIIGVLVGGYLLKFLHIPPDDYVTRGVSLGTNASAISTAQLLTTDPRAAALSSLSFAVFGALMVVLTAIPPVVQRVQALARM